MKQSNPSNHVSRQCCHYFANVSRCLILQTVSPGDGPLNRTETEKSDLQQTDLRSPTDEASLPGAYAQCRELSPLGHLPSPHYTTEL